MNMEPRKQAIIAALRTFINQRPGLEFGNYGDVRAYRSEMRGITKDLHHARELVRAVELSSITADDLLKASTGAFSGRLTIKCERIPAAPPKFARVDWTCGCGLNPKHPTAIHIDDCLHKPRDVATVDYCTGQYFPTEYRRAVCAVLASALWTYTREHCMPEPTLHHNSETGETLHRYKGMHAGDWLRAHFRQQFGRGIASRWFS
jgi:hypothetical protein